MIQVIPYCQPDVGTYGGSETNYNSIWKIAKNIQWQRNHLILGLREITLSKSFAYLRAFTSGENIIRECTRYPVPRGYEKILAAHTFNSFIRFLPDGALVRRPKRRKSLKMLPITDRRPVLIYLPAHTYGDRDDQILLPVPEEIQMETGGDSSIPILSSNRCPRWYEDAVFLGGLLVVSASGKIFTYCVVVRTMKDRKRFYKQTTQHQRFLGTEIECILEPPNVDRLYAATPDTKWQATKPTLLHLNPRQKQYLKELQQRFIKFGDAIIRKVEEEFQEGDEFWNPRLHIPSCNKLPEAKLVPAKMRTGVISQIAGEYETYFELNQDGAVPTHPSEIDGMTRRIGFRLGKTDGTRSSALVPMAGELREKYKDVDRIRIGINLGDDSTPEYIAIFPPDEPNGNYYSIVYYTPKVEEWPEDAELVKGLEKEALRLEALEVVC